MILTIEAPTRWLNANDRVHRIGDNPNVQAWKQAVLDAVWNMEKPIRGWPLWPVTITCTIHKSRNGRWDAHNLYPTLKACIDGLVLASEGHLPDDSNEYVTAVTIRAGEVRKPAQLVLEIEAA